MGRSDSPRDPVLRRLELSRQAAELAREAADQSAYMAAHIEQASRLRPLTLGAEARVADAHRRSEACQRAAARLHESYVRLLERWLGSQGAPREVPPVFMCGIAEAAGWEGAVLTLLTPDGEESLVAASDPTVRAAHELEVTLNEGPSVEATRNAGAAMARGRELDRRWPSFGPAVRELGVRSVASTPIRLARGCGGSVTLMDSRPAPSVRALRDLTGVADALTFALHASDGSLDDDLLDLEMFEQEDFQPLLHQAAGVVYAQCGYAVADALALIRARAFAENRTVAAVADDVIGRRWLP